MSTFEVGEVAIYWRPGSRYHRTECTIRTPLCLIRWFDKMTGTIGEGLAYEADSPMWPSQDTHPVAPYELRKRRPPPDWEKLAGIRNDEQGRELIADAVIEALDEALA